MNFDEYDEEYNEDENFSNENDLDLEDEELSELKQPEEDDSENVNILKEEFKKEKKNMYFDEELVKDLLINKYQPFLDYEINEKGKRVCVSRERADKKVEKEIMANLYLIANAIINKYRYWRFDTVDELQAEALRAMYVYLPNYVPGKGSCFDLFSIICKRHLLNFTLKGYKHRTTADISVCFDVANPDEINYNLFFDDLEKTFLNVINKHFIKEKRKKYIELTSILMEYLNKNKKIVGKNDLLSAFKEYSFKSTEYKKFIADLSPYKQEFFDLV